MATDCYNLFITYLNSFFFQSFSPLKLPMYTMSQYAPTLIDSVSILLFMCVELVSYLFCTQYRFY